MPQSNKLLIGFSVDLTQCVWVICYMYISNLFAFVLACIQCLPSPVIPPLSHDDKMKHLLASWCATSHLTQDFFAFDLMTTVFLGLKGAHTLTLTDIMVQICVHSYEVTETQTYAYFHTHQQLNIVSLVWTSPELNVWSPKQACLKSEVLSPYWVQYFWP